MSNPTTTDEQCNHDLAERETMCADGWCPVCLQAALHDANAALAAERSNAEKAAARAELATNEQKWTVVQGHDANCCRIVNENQQEIAAQSNTALVGRLYATICAKHTASIAAEREKVQHVTARKTHALVSIATQLDWILQHAHELTDQTRKNLSSLIDEAGVNAEEDK